ncbi:MAG: DUF523 domain-containing protein [Nitrospirota bacterium]
MILVSACLAGIDCRYDGCNRRDEKVIEWLKDNIVIPVCPEQMGGLSTPRPAAEIDDGDGNDILNKTTIVIDSDGKDITEKIIKGAEEVLKLAKMTGVTIAYLKDRSPSCGRYHIYRKGKLIEGIGVLAALLERNGIRVNGFKE